ncbi:MAG: dephospho-CoA kinase [Gloeobacteraceae cyanobacterium ES-bin-316]|nr:dephospho-CoA kinase [Ferruginibacter sp.]
MLKIGITGGIGSGKTIICKLFELQKIPVFYADAQAKSIMHTDATLIAALKEAFGKDIYTDNILNRSKLAAQVFSDKEKLAKLNSLVHPAVFKAFDNWISQQEAPYLLKEAALLFESGSDKDCDFTILVKSPLDLKISRVVARDSVSEEEVQKRIKNQMSDEQKEVLADFTILNDEENLVIPQVLKLHQFFLNQVNVK